MPNPDQEFIICGGPSEDDLWEAIREHKATSVPFRIHPLGANGDEFTEKDKHAKLVFERLIGGVWVVQMKALHVTALQAGQRIRFYWIPDKAQGAIELPQWITNGLEWA